MNNIVVDFETFFSKDNVSTARLGNRNYVAHPQFYPYLVSLRGEGVREVHDLQEPGDWDRLAQIGADPANQLWAANANFDMEIWDKTFCTPAHPFKCLLDLGATEQLDFSLAKVCKSLFGIKVDKSTRDNMSGVHWHDLTPAGKKIVSDYCLNDADLEWRLLETLPPHSPAEDAVAELTRWQSRTGVQMDTDLLEKSRTLVCEQIYRAQKSIPWADDGEKCLSYDRFCDWAAAAGLPIPSNLSKEDLETTALVDSNPALKEMVGHMRTLRKANTLLKKIESAIDRTGPDGVMPLELMYCGARHTRRWSCRGFNAQNLEKEPIILSGVKPADFAERMRLGQLDIPGFEYIYPRAWIMPRPGKKFLIVDYSQIEPRCLHWLVGNLKMLEMISAGYSVYEAYARSVNLWSGPDQLKKADPAKYKLIKAQVLGLGYGMGAAKFRDTAARDGIILRRYTIGEGDDVRVVDEAAQAVSQFRAANKGIVQMWHRLDNLIKKAAMDGDHLLALEMPTGELLRHFNVRATSHGYATLTIRDNRSPMSAVDNLWGGGLTENITQRMARDVVAEALVRAHREGWQCRFSSHDEGIFEIDADANEEEALHELSKVLTVAPDWAPGLPLAVEGEVAHRYCKL